MSDETPSQPQNPLRPPRGRPRPQPKGFDDAILSDEEVERRVGVRGGGTPRAPIERAARVPRTARRSGKTTARDVLLLIALVIAGLVAVRVFLPDGPLTASATSTPGASQAVAATLAPPPSATQGPTPGLQTLTPLPTPTAGPTAAPTAVPTAAPPTPTLKPGQTPKPTPKVTPRPTPKPTATPRITAPPTPAPTSGPGTATVHVVMHVANDRGGTAVASDWTMKITGEVGSGVSPNNFPGSESGTTVTITAGKGYLVTDNTAVAGYAFSRSAECSGSPGVGLAAGASVICTITRSDIAPRLNLTIAYVGTEASAQLSVSGANASPSSVSSTGATTVTLDADASWAVSEVSGPSGYTLVTSGTCSSPGLALAEVVSCTYTYTEPSPSPSVLFPYLLLPLLRPRRWRQTTTG